MKSWLSILVLSILFSWPVQAQDDVAPDLLAPSGAWLVGPTTLADGSDIETGGMPCVMVNKFSNGSELRFSGGGEEILALALNVGTPTFDVKQSYLITIGFEGQESINLPAEAFSEDTVVVGTEPGKAFYKFLKEKPSMTLKLGTSVMEFSLLGVSHGLKRLEDCYKPLPEAPAKESIKAVEAPVLPATGIKKLDEVTAQKVDELRKEITGNAVPTPTEMKEPVQPPPLKDAKPRDILSPGTAAPTTGEGQQMRWRAMKGSDLQSTLDLWAQSMKARVIWKAGRSFSLPESMVLQGTFEMAVEAVLARFPHGQARPVGKIYVDPASGQKTLVIEQDKPESLPGGTGSYAPIGAP